MYLRIWQYDVRPEETERFVVVYGGNGNWARLFARAEGFEGTELFRSAGAPARFITVDRWRDQASRQAFRHERQGEYEALDREVEHLTRDELSLLEGTVAPSVDSARRSPDVDGVDDR